MVFKRAKHGLRGYSIPRHSASGARERRVVRERGREREWCVYVCARICREAASEVIDNKAS